MSGSICNRHHQFLKKWIIYMQLVIYGGYAFIFILSFSHIVVYTNMYAIFPDKKEAPLRASVFPNSLEMKLIAPPLPPGFSGIPPGVFNAIQDAEAVPFPPESSYGESENVRRSAGLPVAKSVAGQSVPRPASGRRANRARR
jgi:hypothetical protein